MLSHCVELDKMQLKIQIPYHWNQEVAIKYFQTHCPAAQLTLEGKSGLLSFKCYADMLDAMKCASIPHLDSTPTLQMYYDTKYFYVATHKIKVHGQQGTFQLNSRQIERLNSCFLVS